MSVQRKFTMRVGYNGLKFIIIVQLREYNFTYQKVCPSARKDGLRTLIIYLNLRQRRHD